MHHFKIARASTGRELKWTNLEVLEGGETQGFRFKFKLPIGVRKRASVSNVQRPSGSYSEYECILLWEKLVIVC